MTLSSTRTGFLLMATASLLFAVMSALVRFASDLPVHTLAFFRFAFGAVVILGLAAVRVVRLRMVNRSFLFWRGVLGGMAVYLYYLAICKVGLAKGTVLSYTYPIFVPLFGAVVLRERVSLRVGLAVPVAFFGVYLIASPGNVLTFNRYDVAALMCGVLSASAVVCIKRLRETDSPQVIFLSQCVFGMTLVGWPAAKSGLGGPLALLPVLLGIGLFSVAAQLLMTYSYKLVPATSGSLLGYLTPLFNVLIGVVVFGEKLGVNGLAGCLLVLVVSVYVSLATPER